MTRGGDPPLTSLRDSAQAVGTIAGTAAGLIAFVYLLGGAVMWLRFHTADLPPDESVAAMSREMLLTVGLRVIVLPAMVAGGLAIALVAASRASDKNGFPEEQFKALNERVRARVTKLRKTKEPAEPEPAKAKVASRPQSRRVKRTWWIGVAIVLALVLVLPFSAGGLVWLTVVFVIIYWGRGFGFEARPSSEVSQVRLAMVVISVAAIISLGRQFDDPVQLLEARVEFPAAAKQLPIDGVLVSEDESVVYIGDREDGLVRSVKRADVAKLTMGPPIEYAPIPSIMSRVVGGGRWSVTPVGLWCDGIRYGWLHLGDRCQGSPHPVLKPGQQTFFVARVAGGDEPGVINIWVRCPEEAPHNCKGYARLATVKEYGAPALGVLATNRRLPLPPLREDATPFSVEPGRTGAAVIPIRLNDWTTLATKAALGESAPLQLVRMQVTLSADPRGKSVFVRSEHNIRFTQPPELPEP